MSAPLRPAARLLVIALTVAVVAGAVWGYWRGGGPIVDTEREIAPVTCDSAQAARLALDSLAHLDPFPSAVYRFARDSAGMRLVTWPDRERGATVVDGMAIIRIDAQCRIVSLVQTDSA